MLQMILDSRNLLEPGSAEVDMLDGRMTAMGVSDSPATSVQPKSTTAEEVHKTNSNADFETRNNTKAGSRAGPACSEGLQGDQERNAAFAQRIGVIFSAMYNVFVDADVLETIHDVAGRLSASIASSEERNSTELGRLVHFADDRSQDRVREILTVYADKSLQKRVSATSVKKQRSAFITKRISKGGIIFSRSMGLASLRQEHNDQHAHNEMVHKCKIIQQVCYIYSYWTYEITPGDA